MNVATDLQLLGLRFLAPVEGCRCGACRAMDLGHDIDYLATDVSGRLLFIAWRSQPQYDYQTITVRVTNDRGNPNVQASKLNDGRSRADLYVQSYPSGIAHATRTAVASAVAVERICSHQRRLTGTGGQTFAVLCAQCCEGLSYTSRSDSITRPALDVEAELDAIVERLPWPKKAA